MKLKALSNIDYLCILCGKLLPEMVGLVLLAWAILHLERTVYKKFIISFHATGLFWYP